MATISSTVEHSEQHVHPDDGQLSLTPDSKLPSSLHWSTVLSKNTKKLMEKGQGKLKSRHVGHVGQYSVERKNTPRSKAQTNSIDVTIVLFLILLLKMSGASGFSNLQAK